jgi:tetratricopeptide (TPR) repeat protein
MVIRNILVSVLLVFVVAMAGVAQGRWSWPEKPENLQVLPKDFKGAQLRPVMTGFTRALGVRCQYCHIGEEGQSLSTFDFVSDANPNKNRARAMMKMLGDINVHLKTMDRSGDVFVTMGCHTCHQGRPKPYTLEEELRVSYKSNGVEGAIARYNALKKTSYGRGGYDFGEGALNSFGYEILGTGDARGAVTILELNTTEFPESANAWDSLGEASLKAGDRLKAKQSYERSLHLDPKSQNARKMLELIERDGG